MKWFILIYVLGCIWAYVLTHYFATKHIAKHECNRNWTRADSWWLVAYTFGSWISFFTVIYIHHKYIIKDNE